MSQTSQAATLSAETETPPSQRPHIYHVATSFACDRETCELGEDYPELQKIERAYRLLERRLERAPALLHARCAIKSAHSLSESLADARHDASFGSTLSLAEDAFGEARVVKIARTFAPKSR
ncbi:MAG: hypothetical protein SGI91_21130 [Alphaproteobacteria bacterium]|nr:hypothetical protein [Alphaproteobacteria bacterium]